ncbi:MAG TPA: stage II sporulation protein M [Acidimicrobiia bacterium]|nr:stage II sporulation protein M [Acidimicrobiia bacterium]
MATREQFVAERSAAWDELDDLVRRAGRRPARLAPADVLALGRHYRAAAGDLALARRRFPGDPVVARLDALVARGRHAVYADAPRRGSALDWLVRGFWRRVHERPDLVIAAALLLFVPLLLAAYWGWRDPGDAAGLVPQQFRSITEPRPAGQDLGLAVDEQAAFASEIFTNNIRVTLLAFGGGMLLGVGTALVLVYNGVLIGAIAGLAISAGNGRPFFELVTAHGVLELSCIVVAGSAGLRLGDAILHPGTRARGEALRAEARGATETMLGVVLLLVLAGLVEGFVTPAGLGLTAVLVIGFALGGAMWGLVVVRGRRPRAAPAP